MEGKIERRDGPPLEGGSKWSDANLKMDRRRALRPGLLGEDKEGQEGEHWMVASTTIGEFIAATN